MPHTSLSQSAQWDAIHLYAQSEHELESLTRAFLPVQQGIQKLK